MNPFYFRLARVTLVIIHGYCRLTPSPATDKTWIIFFLHSIFWVITSFIWTIIPVKGRLICQTWWNVTVTRSSRNRKNLNGCLRERQNDISHMSVPLFQCKPNIVLSSSSLFYVQKLKLWIPQTTEIGSFKFCLQQDYFSHSKNWQQNVNQLVRIHTIMRKLNNTANQPVVLGKLQQTAELKVGTYKKFKITLE